MLSVAGHVLLLQRQSAGGSRHDAVLDVHDDVADVGEASVWYHI